MCGIAGIYAYHYAANPVDREELSGIRDRMAARGPDGSGEWFSADGRVGLGHRRLAIIDLSPAGAQPMASADGRYVVSFNGEIYNYRELRASLAARGVEFRTQSDTEVLLELYRARGTEMFRELRGMYAFILWDSAKNAMLLARDPYGIKPLYYADDGWTCRAASQVKALLASPRVSRDPEPAGLVGFYLWGSVPEPFTLYREIRQVPAGHYVWIDELGAGAPEEHTSIAKIIAGVDAPRHPRESGDAVSSGDLQERVRSALLESVRYHLVADVPVGVFLSAGIDSGTLVALMREVGYRDITTVTLAFDEFTGTENDEAPLAEQVARQHGTRHHTRRVSFAEFQTDLPKILEAMDQPTIDGINTWFVAKAAREQGLKVALSGLGGDELFAGYPSFRQVPRWVRWMAVPSRIPGAGFVFRRLAQTFASGTSPKLAGIVQYGGTYAGAYFLKRALHLPWELREIVSPDDCEEGLRRLGLLGAAGRVLRPDPGSPYGRLAALEASVYMRNQLLRDTDWASMAHSLEVRVPLVDPHLLAQLATPICNGTINGKRLLAASARPALPMAVVDRPKTGFATPIERWLREVTNQRDERGPWARRWAREVSRLARAA